MTWHHVDSRLPEHANPVLICCRDYGDGPVFLIAFFEDGVWRENTDGEPIGTDLSGDVTHWAEIPMPEE